MRFDFLGVGNLGLIWVGMTKDQVRVALKEPYEEFIKTSTSIVKTDAFNSLNLHVFYEGSGKLKGVEFFGGSEFFLEGRKVIDESIEEVQCILNGMGVEVDVNESGFSVKKIGLRFCIPDIGENGAVVESIYVEMNSVCV